jgi:cation:H+ antiporter
MAIEILFITLGIALLLCSGEVLVKNVSLLAKAMGVPTLVVGMTVVAFGTSAPELAVNVLAATQGKSGISFGNIVGSNIANIGLILGCSALARVLVMEPLVIRKDIPMMLVATIVFTALGLALNPGVFGRAEAGVLLVLFCAYLVVMYIEASSGDPSHPFARHAIEHHTEEETRALWKYSALTAVGLVGIWAGGDMTVNAASKIAESLGVPEAIIGLSVVAVGTSLPELVVSVIAATRGSTALAIGNVVGSNIFNLLLVMSACSIIAPVEVPEGGVLDLAVMGAFSVLMLIFATTHRRSILRWEGGLMLLGYIAYIAYRVATA